MAETARSNEFTALLMSHQRRLYLYIASFVPHPHDVDDVLQRVNTVLLTKAGEFAPGSDFGAWAASTAHFEILAFRKTHGREKLVFSSEVIETLAADAGEQDELLEARRLALAECLEKQRPEDRALIDRRYREEATVRQMAEETGRPSKSIYRSLERARMSLLTCIEQTIAREEQTP